MNNPKFNEGDLVALLNPDSMYFDDYFIVMGHYPTLIGDSSIKYKTIGFQTNIFYAFKESALYLYTPENRTKILLGLDLEE